MDKKLTDEQLEELAREKQREYQREWRRNNPDKVRKYNQSYWRRRAIRELKENKGNNQGQAMISKDDLEALEGDLRGFLLCTIPQIPLTSKNALQGKIKQKNKYPEFLEALKIE